MDSMPVTIRRCMDAIVENVGKVELGALIYYVRSQSIYFHSKICSQYLHL